MAFRATTPTRPSVGLVSSPEKGEGLPPAVGQRLDKSFFVPASRVRQRESGLVGSCDQSPRLASRSATATRSWGHPWPGRSFVARNVDGAAQEDA